MAFNGETMLVMLIIRNRSSDKSFLHYDQFVQDMLLRHSRELFLALLHIALHCRRSILACINAKNHSDCKNHRKNQANYVMNVDCFFSCFPDPYVRVLLCRETGWEKKETKTKRNTRNPVWNESLMLNCATDSYSPLGIFSMVVSVIHHSLVGKDEIMGHVFFSLDAKQESARLHWKHVGETPHKLQAEWHTLIDPEDL